MPSSALIIRVSLRGSSYSFLTLQPLKLCGFRRNEVSDADSIQQIYGCGFQANAFSFGALSCPVASDVNDRRHASDLHN